MSIAIEGKVRRLTYQEWLYFHRIDQNKCLGRCTNEELCCAETHEKQNIEDFLRQQEEDGVFLESLSLPAGKREAVSL